jgi:hypothetical protein
MVGSRLQSNFGSRPCRLAKKRALALADNKIAEGAGWDRERLSIELPALADLLIEDNLDISVTGYG